MTKADRTLFKFGNRLKQAATKINEQFGVKVVTQEMMVSALKLGIRKGELKEGYTDALKQLKFNKKNNYDFHVLINLLHSLRDPTYDVPPPATTAPPADNDTHSASMAKTRGGGSNRGKGGKGRGGKGGGRGGKGGKGRRSYYVNTSPTGDDVVTAELAPKTNLDAPCFNKIKHGSCGNQDCPFNHDFDIVDTRPKRPRSETKESTSVSQHSHHESTSVSQHSSPNTTTHNTGNVRANAPPISEDLDNKHNSSDDDPFDYYNDLGFGHKANSVQSSPTTAPMGCNFLYPFLLAQFFISALAGKLFLGAKYLMFYLVLLLLLPKFLLERVQRLFQRAPPKFFCSAAAPFLRALYQIILDCGCTFTMSGDEGLFLPGSLVKIDESVGMAESGLSAKATHYGKLCINGHLIDALFVPQFKQTMISLGQLERLGLKYNQVNLFRDLVTPTGSIFLSFTLTNNNLYELNNRNLAQSSSSATSAARERTERS